MKKHLKIILPLLITFIVVFSVYSLKIHEHDILPQTTLVKSFSETGARLVASEVYFWSQLDENYYDIEEKRKMIDVFSKSLGIIKDSTYTSKSANNDNMHKIEIRGRAENGVIIDICIQHNKESGITKEGFLSVNLSEDSSYNGIYSMGQKVSELFKKYRLKPKMSSCITGNFDGKLEDTNLNTIAGKIFEGFRAKKVEGMRDKNLISVSAYSPSMGEAVQVNGNKVNLNLAIRYNSYENKTYIWLATPLIITEY